MEKRSGWLQRAAVVVAMASGVYGGPADTVKSDESNWRLPATHPRLLANEADIEAMRKRVAYDPVFAGFAESVQKQADTLLPADPVARKLTGTWTSVHSSSTPTDSAGRWTWVARTTPASSRAE